MEGLYDKFKKYLSSASKEQLQKDGERLKQLSQGGPNMLIYIDSIVRQEYTCSEITCQTPQVNNNHEFNSSAKYYIAA